MAYLAGVDVSVYQTPSDWTSAGLTFVIARASINLTKDAQFNAHIAKAKAAGLMTGAYHFNWGPDADPATVDSTPEQQAQFFVAAAGDVDFLFLDVEGSRAFTTAEAKAFIAEVHRAGKKVGLYMSDSTYRTGLGQDYDWVARWSTSEPTSVAWEFWQYTSSGTATDGGRLDLDSFSGTLAALKALSNITYPEYTVDTVFKTPKVALIPKGTRLYLNPNLVASTSDIIIDPARDMPVAGKNADGTLVVGYVPLTNPPAMLTPYYVKPAGITVRDVPLEDGITQATVDAAVASQKASDTQEYNSLAVKFNDVQQQLDDTKTQLGLTQAAQADAEHQLGQTQSALQAMEADRDALQTKSDADDAELLPARALKTALGDFLALTSQNSSSPTP